jgi:hypothetical protein
MRSRGSTNTFTTIFETSSGIALSTTVRDAGLGLYGIGAHVIVEVGRQFTVANVISVATVVLPSCWDGGGRRKVPLGKGDSGGRRGEEGK